MLRCAEGSYPARIVALSTERATLTDDDPDRVVALLAGRTCGLQILDVGWVEATSDGAVLGGIGLRIEAASAERRALVTLLYSAPRDDIARQARLSGALAGLMRRSLGGV